MPSLGVIDLRPSARGRKPPAGQTSLFAPRTPRNEPPKRPLPLRARRRRKRLAIAFFTLLCIAGFAYGIHYVSYLPQLNIKTLSVSGAQHVSTQAIVDDAQTVLYDGSFRFISNQNIFFYPRSELEARIVADFPRVFKVYASRPSALSTVLDIHVTEREPFAQWCSSEGQCYDMDSGGFIFAIAGAREASSTRTEYVFEGGVSASSTPIGETFAPSHLASLEALLAELGQNGFLPRGIIVENDSDFSVPLEHAYFLKASFGTSPDTLVHNLRLVLASEALQGNAGSLEYVDLRFGDRVYYKLKGEEQRSQ